MRRQLSITADQFAVPVNLAGVFHAGQEQLKVGFDIGCGGDAKVQPVPAKAGIGVVCLRAPRTIDKDGFPTVFTRSVVDVGIGPSQVVADMETPGSGEIDRTFAEPVDRDNGGGGRGLRVGKGKMESEEQEYE